MEIYVVTIGTDYCDARKVCNLIENQKFDSVEIARETIFEKLNEPDNAFEDVSIYKLTDFMEEVNDQVLDNLTNYFISYIQIGK